MPQSTNLLSFIAPYSGEATSRKVSPEPARPAKEAETADVLRRIAEAALSATGASGAALALQQDNAVVCVARAGEMAPPLGAKLSNSTGVSGECLRTGQALRCDDTEIDTRVDRDACRALGLRSLAIAPVKADNRVVGILEVFSPDSHAFTNRHLDVLNQLSELVLDDYGSAADEDAMVAAEDASAPSPVLVPAVEAPQQHLLIEKEPEIPTSAPPPVVLALPIPPISGARPQPATPTPGEVDIAAYLEEQETAYSNNRARRPFLVLIGLAALVLVAATVLTLFWRKMRVQEDESAKAAQSPKPALLSTSSNAGVPQPNTSPQDVSTQQPAQNQQPQQVSDKRSGAAPLIKASARDVVRQASELDGDLTKPIRIVSPSQSAASDSDTPPALDSSAANQGGQVLTTLLNVPASLPERSLPLSQGVKGGELQYRVPPVYPVQAKTMRQQGRVVLRALITETGTIQDVRVVSGPPILAQAATEAVKKWRYKPFKLNGKPVPMETEVKVDFKLP